MRLIAQEAFELGIDRGFALQVLALLIRTGDEETAFLETAGPFRTPGVLGHFLHQLDFGEAGGLFFFDEPLEQSVEHLLVFAFENLKHSGEAVLSGVLRHFFAAGVRDRTRAFLSIGAVGCEFAFGEEHELISFFRLFIWPLAYAHGSAKTMTDERAGLGRRRRSAC